MGLPGIFTIHEWLFCFLGFHVGKLYQAVPWIRHGFCWGPDSWWLSRWPSGFVTWQLSFKQTCSIGSMGLVYLPTFTYIYHRNQPNVGTYTIHGCYGCGWFTWWWQLEDFFSMESNATPAGDTLQHRQHRFKGCLDPPSPYLQDQVSNIFYFYPGKLADSFEAILTSITYFSDGLGWWKTPPSSSGTLTTWKISWHFGTRNIRRSWIRVEDLSFVGKKSNKFGDGTGSWSVYDRVL